MSGPRIVVTVQAPAAADDAALARRKNARYGDELRAHGGEPILVDETSDRRARAEAWAAMDGLLLTGGADVGPERYGQAAAGAREVEAGRDGLEAEAFAAAQARGRPVLGICRGLQVINVLMGGSLVQHVDGHGSPAYGSGPANRHPLTVSPGSRLATILDPAAIRGPTLSVNTYHHQAVRPADLAPGLVASAASESEIGPLVEGLEAAPGAGFLVAVQCHPERTESTPAEFDRLWSAFVAACREPLRPGADRPR
jgi:putative glutamine amidotransferase